MNKNYLHLFAIVTGSTLLNVSTPVEAYNPYDLTTTIRISGQFPSGMPDNYRDNEEEWIKDLHPIQNWSNLWFSTSTTFLSISQYPSSGGRYTDNDAELQVNNLKIRNDSGTLHYLIQDNTQSTIRAWMLAEADYMAPSWAFELELSIGSAAARIGQNNSFYAMRTGTYYFDSVDFYSFAYSNPWKDFRGKLSNVQLTVIGIPEPSTWATFILGFFAVGALYRRQAHLVSR